MIPRPLPTAADAWKQALFAAHDLCLRHVREENAQAQRYVERGERLACMLAEERVSAYRLLADEIRELLEDDTMNGGEGRDRR
ncbi:MAG: hypothetical protein PVJ64_00455 [Gemmatimonadales bacterium]